MDASSVDEAKGILAAIERDLGFTIGAWKIYEALFTVENADFLDVTAPGFFGVVDLIMLRDACVSIRRLVTDPASGRRDGTLPNASLAGLIERLDQAQRAPLFAALETLRPEATAIAAFAEKHVAHHNSDYATSKQVLPAIDKDSFRRVFKGAAAIVGHAAKALGLSEIRDVQSAVVPRGATELLRFLKSAGRPGYERPFRVAITLDGVPAVSAEVLRELLFKIAPEAEAEVVPVASGGELETSMTVIAADALGALVNARALLNDALPGIDAGNAVRVSAALIDSDEGE